MSLVDFWLPSTVWPAYCEKKLAHRMPISSPKKSHLCCCCIFTVGFSETSQKKGANLPALMFLFSKGSKKEREREREKQKQFQRWNASETYGQLMCSRCRDKQRYRKLKFLNKKLSGKKSILKHHQKQDARLFLISIYNV